MAKLEDLSVGSVVNGLLSGEPITVVSTKWYGSSSMEVFYKTNQGTTGSQILFRDDETSLTVLEKSLPWSFDVDAIPPPLSRSRIRFPLYTRRCFRVCRCDTCLPMTRALAKPS